MRLQLFLILLLIALFMGCEAPTSMERPKPDADNGGLFLPEGFSALVVADSVGPTRHIAVNSNGDIYAKLRIIDGDRGNVAMRDTTGDGRMDIFQRFGEYPNDGSFATEMRVHNGYLYFSSELVVYRQKLDPDQLVPPGKPEIMLTDHHPLQWHNAKSIAFDNEGGMYVTFSAPTNVCETWMPELGAYGTPYPCPQLTEHAGIWRFDANKWGQTQADGTRFATGLRSIVGIAWNEKDNSLYAVQHGRDYLSNHAAQYYSVWQNASLPAEEFMKVKQGDDFGWPYSYYDPFKKKRLIAPEYGGDGKKEVSDFVDPLMGMPAHWAPNDLLFYKGNQFPARYQQGAFVAFHGSTNRSPYPQAGYIVAFIPFEDGKPNDRWEVFADGFAGVDTVKTVNDAKYRPMGLSEGPDGSLYISESKNGRIWRILFSGDAAAFGEKELEKMEQRKSRTYIKIPDEKGDLLPTAK